MTEHTAVFLAVGFLLTVLVTVLQSPAAAAQQIRPATEADIPLMVEKAVGQAPQSSTAAKYARRFTTLMAQADTIALVSEAEGHVNGILIAARAPESPFLPQEAAHYIALNWVAENEGNTIQQALFQELFRQAAARGVTQFAIPTEC